MAKWLPFLDVRPGVHSIASVLRRRPSRHLLRSPSGESEGLRKGPERREVKLRHKWRRGVDPMRPKGLKGASHRGGGAAKRRAPERAVGHTGGAQAKARRKAQGKKKKNVRVVAAARQMGAGRVQISLSPVGQVATSVHAVPVVAPAVSGWRARVQASASKLFVF